MRSSPIVLIALVYNDNGMATWCYEASRALKKQGCVVSLACKKLVQVPDDLKEDAFEVNLEYQNSSLIQKVILRFKRSLQFMLPVQPDSCVVQACLAILKHRNSYPTHIILNQSSFVCPQVALPQWVVGWAWPVSFSGYLNKIWLPSNNSYVNLVKNYWYWYRMDVKGYRLAKGVLAVTKCMEDDLQQMNINATCVYPGTAVNKVNVIDKGKQEATCLKFVSAALHLEDKRKNIESIVDAFIKIKAIGIPFQLTLIGEYTEVFERKIKAYLPETILPGKVSRSDLMQIIRKADVFVYASVQDDWGYVLVEAMANGLALLAPNQVPFNEIIANTGYLYNANQQNSLEKSLKAIILNAPQTSADKVWFTHRYNQLFSTTAFGKNLLKAIA